MSNKHAYLIMAHTDFPILIELLKALDDSRNDIFLHIDRKAQNVPFEELRSSVKRTNMFFTDRMDVNWGAPSQIKCELLLLETAMSSENYKYYHLMTGQTYPIKSQNYIHDFFEKNEGKEFIGYDNSRDYSERVRYLQLFPEIGKATTRLKKAQYRLRSGFIKLQKKVGFQKKGLSRYEIKKGFVYWSLTQAAAEYIVSNKTIIDNMIVYSICADEVFSHTLIYNSEFRDRIYNYNDQFASCMRIVKPVRSWGDHKDIGKEENSYTLEDLDQLMNSEKIFALKFCGNTGLELISSLYKKLNESV